MKSWSMQQQAQAFLMIATSPRFRTMSVQDALAEMLENGFIPQMEQEETCDHAEATSVTAR